MKDATMKKDIKDYIHLYPGCEVQVTTPSATFTAKFVGLFFDIWNTVSKKHELTVQVLVGETYHCYKIEQCKPLFRKLSSMTEEEAVEFIHSKYRSILTNIDRTEITKVSFGTTKNIINFTYFRRRGHGAELGSKTYYVNESDHEQFLYLLSKGFWLFNESWFDEGLILDKDTVK